MLTAKLSFYQRNFIFWLVSLLFCYSDKFLIFFFVLIFMPLCKYFDWPVFFPAGWALQAPFLSLNIMMLSCTLTGFYTVIICIHDLLMNCRTAFLLIWSWLCTCYAHFPQGFNFCDTNYGCLITLLAVMLHIVHIPAPYQCDGVRYVTGYVPEFTNASLPSDLFGSGAFIGIHVFWFLLIVIL